MIDTAGDIAELRERLERAEAALTAMPLFTGGGGGSDAHLYEILHGNIIDALNNADGIKSIAAIPAELPVAWKDYVIEDVLADATIVDDGFGVALDKQNQSLIWFCNAPTYVSSDLYAGMEIYAPQTITIPIIGNNGSIAFQATPRWVAQ